MKSSINRRILTVLTLLFSISLFASGQAFAWTISRDFEGGTIGQLAEGAVGFSGALGITYSSDIVHSGTRSVKCDCIRGQEVQPSGGFWTGTANNGQEIWYRAYLYFPSGFSWNNGIGPVIKVMRVTSTRSDNAHLSVFASTSGEILLSNELADIQSGTGVKFDFDRWQSIEFYVKLSHVAGQGIFRIWKDGILIANNTTAPTLSASGQSIAPNHLFFNNWNNGAPKDQSFYADDFVLTTDTPSNVDASGNLMIGPTDWGRAVSPPAGDTTPPVISGGLPSGTLAYGTTSTNMAVTTNENATCKYGTANVAYASMPNTFSATGSTSHSQTLSGLISGGSYTYYVRCMDGSNNADATSTIISFNVSNTPLVVNGACGSASGRAFSSLTSSSPNLCATGNVASFAGTGPWTWGCNGSGGGTSTASTACSASLTTATLLLSESFEDANFTSRGWYDSSTQGTIVSGGQSGNCLQWAWTQGQMLPANVGGMTRRKFTATDKMYVAFYVKFQSGWRGSQLAYHPHILSVLSNLDGDWAAPSDSYLNTYIEFLSDIGSPYAIRPQLKLQDTLRTNKSYGVNGTPINATGTPVNISALTENRSVNACNGYKAGSDSGTGHDCYDEGGGVWYSATNWLIPNVTVSTNAWHYVEVYFQMNSINGGIGQPDGIMQEWIDGIQVFNKNNIIYRTGYGTDATKKWAQFDLQAYIGSPGSPITQTMWLDELKVYDGLPTGTTTKPPAPTGLKVIGQ